MKIKNNLLTYGLVGIGGLVVGGVAALYFVGLPVFKLAIGELVELCPSCMQDAKGSKCQNCAQHVMDKSMKQFGFGL